MKKPHGALSKDELLALVKPGQVIYKVFKGRDDFDTGEISQFVCTGNISYTGSSIIEAVDYKKALYLNNWFEKKWGYVFDNYFHALAYSLKLKAEHGQKAKSEERTGVAGAP